MKWHSITWKPSATYKDRLACMAFLMGQDDPAMPSEFFINDRWVDERNSN